MTQLARKLSLAVTAAAAIAVVACTNGIEPLEETGATLEGTVTYGTEKVPLALVIVAKPGSGGGSASAFADDDGHFRVENVPVGDVQIGVNTDATKGQMMSRAMAGTDPTKKGKKAVMPKYVEVPKKFHEPSASGLTARTEKGVTQHDIKIPR